jgi:hypothetical protein
VALSNNGETDMTRQQSEFLIALQSIHPRLAGYAQDRFDKGDSLDQVQDSLRRASEVREGAEKAKA